MNQTKEQCFEQLLLGRPIKSEGWLGDIRTQAREHASTVKFPSTQHEDWRFTDLSSLYAHDFHSIDSYAHLSLSDIETFLIPETIRLVFVDGCYAADLSDLSLAGDGVTVASLAERLGDPLVAQHFGQHAPYQQDAFVALNTNFFEDGAWIHVAENVVTPIHLLYVASKREAVSAIYPRSMLVVDPTSSATVVEEYVGLGDSVYFSNAVTEVVLHADARLQHIRVQREVKQAFHIGHCSVESAANSVYSATSIALGARVSRHSLHVAQRGEGAKMLLDGLVSIEGRQIADTHTLIDHAAPRGISKQLQKCIANGAAHAIFGGKIKVHIGAVGSDSEQSSRNLLLSDKARIDTQPQLEIFNDDVKCKHGATIGQIDTDALFFLKCRGLSEEYARNLLTHAFAAEIIVKIPVPWLVASLVASLGKTILERTSGV